MSIQTSVEMSSVDGKRSCLASISLGNDHEDEDNTEEGEEHDGVTFKVLD
jgi:hypothetical protein